VNDKTPNNRPTLATVSDVIDAVYGGTAKAAEALGVTKAAVSNYRAHNSFPATRYSSMISYIRQRGFRAPASLWKQH
jgi:hypothetical protein